MSRARSGKIGWSWSLSVVVVEHPRLKIVLTHQAADLLVV
jgi:predicted TIM-barrel fold metal-dependent hydrolase